VTELIVLYKTPNDPDRFDKYYREVHGPMTSKLPGLKGCKYGPARALDGGAGEFFWYWSGTFDSRQAASTPWLRQKAWRALPTCQTIIMMIRSSCSSKSRRFVFDEPTTNIGIIGLKRSAPW
jgi:uncharacterized protein (TIGR02118 family)